MLLKANGKTPHRLHTLAGLIYACDDQAPCIAVCNLDGKLVRRIDSIGKSEFQFCNLRGVAVDGERKVIFVAEMDRVHVLTLEGGFVRTFGLGGCGKGAAINTSCDTPELALIVDHCIQVCAVLFSFALRARVFSGVRLQRQRAAQHTWTIHLPKQRVC